MDKISGWLFAVIALTWLLTQLGVIIGSQSVHNWIAIVALAFIGIKAGLGK